MSQYENAARHYEKAASLDSKNIEAHFNLGSIYEQLDRVELACAAYETVKKLDPDNQIATEALFRLKQ